MATFQCWHTDDGLGVDADCVEDVDAADAAEAARRFALWHEDGEDYALVSVLDPANGEEVDYKCTYHRTIDCSAKVMRRQRRGGE